MAVRKLTDDHIHLGKAAAGTSKLHGKHKIRSVVTYPDSFRETVLQVEDEQGHKKVLYLTDAAALEVVKGLLLEQCQLGRAVGMTVDEEFRRILKKVEACIAAEEEDAWQVVECVRRNNGLLE